MSAHQILINTKTQRRIARVLIPKPFQEPFDYRVPEGWNLERGSYVFVPFGKQKLWGVVWELTNHSCLEENQIKTLERLSTAPSLKDSLFQFIEKTASYTMAPLGLVLKMVMAVPEALEKEPSNPCGEELVFRPCDLKEDQYSAGENIKNFVRKKSFQAVLLEGVTGSGKTEVYFEGIKEASLQGRQSLVLVPEISLSTQWIDRFVHRFGIRPTVWHSDLTKAQRQKAWRSISEGESHVIIGARSALFLPYKDLGCIVVDEEHDQSYKQETSVVYHARDLGVMRGQCEQCPVILSSATPSLETLYNVHQGKYKKLSLSRRYGEALMPQVTLVDRRESRRSGEWISLILQNEIKETLNRGEQVLLFLNRRGYAPLMVCSSCGYHVDCPNCTTWLVYHKAKHFLKCHHCDYTCSPVFACPQCQTVDSFSPCGPGVERIAEEVVQLFPKARYAVMTSDTFSSPKKAEMLIKAIQDREVDIIIGTQVMAKGHHFPFLTLVGIIDGDLGLAGGDLRASEKTYQLLHQVGGRAGRDQMPGHVFLQTYIPDHPVMQSIKNYDHDSFLKMEMESREILGLPPFGRLAALIIGGKKEEETERYVRTMLSLAPNHSKIQILGPAPAPLYKLHHWYRWRFLVKTPKEVSVQKVVKAWMEKLKDHPSFLKITIDIDPYSFL